MIKVSLYLLDILSLAAYIVFCTGQAFSQLFGLVSPESVHAESLFHRDQ